MFEIDNYCFEKCLKNPENPFTEEDNNCISKGILFTNEK